MDLKDTRVIFTDKANQTLDQIMQDFKLEESYEEHFKKSQSGVASNIVVIDKIIKSLFLGITNEKLAADVFQKDLQLSPNDSSRILSEIKTKIIPNLEKLSETEINNPKKNSDNNSVERKELKPTPTKENTKLDTDSPIKSPVGKSQNESPASLQNKTPSPKKQKEDTYREKV